MLRQNPVAAVFANQHDMAMQGWTPGWSGERGNHTILRERDQKIRGGDLCLQLSRINICISPGGPNIVDGHICLAPIPLQPIISFGPYLEMITALFIEHMWYMIFFVCCRENAYRTASRYHSVAAYFDLGIMCSTYIHNHCAQGSKLSNHIAALNRRPSSQCCAHIRPYAPFRSPLFRYSCGSLLFDFSEV